MKISIDPGQACGICVWKDGRPVLLKTIRARGDTYPERRANLWNSMFLFFSTVEEQLSEEITEWAIEDFQPGYSKNIKQTRRLENLKGYLIHGLEQWNEVYPTPVREIGKGTTPKKAATTLCKLLQLEGDQNAKDAVHIGCIAGWLEDKRHGKIRQ